MNNPFDDYLTLLDQMAKELSHLSDLAKQKTEAVLQNDLIALDEVLKKEQASALTFRGLEQKQATLLNATGLMDVKLSSLVENYPPKKRLACKEMVEKLQHQYDVYHCSAEVARNTLECNLHEIEKILASAAAAQNGPGYEAAPPEVPVGMKTDFRA